MSNSKARAYSRASEGKACEEHTTCEGKAFEECGYIKEPAGIVFVVDSTPLTNEDRKKISEVIAYYKSTGRKMPKTKTLKPHRVPRISKNGDA